jgi:hypothetical protein
VVYRDVRDAAEGCRTSGLRAGLPGYSGAGSGRSRNQPLAGEQTPAGPGVRPDPAGCQGQSRCAGCLYAAAYPIERNGELLLYYGSNNGKHSDWRDGFFCLARLRRDGFAGMQADGSGRIVTRPLEWKGAGLRVSADAAHGSIVAKVLRGDSVIAESHPLTGSEPEIPLRWKKAAPAELRGNPVRIDFELRSAKLYSFIQA